MLLHPVTFWVIQIIVMTGSIVEFYRLSPGNHKPLIIIAGVFSALWLYIVTLLMTIGIGTPLLYLPLLIILIAIHTGELYSSSSQPANSAFSTTVTALLYIAVPWSLMPLSAYGYSETGTLLEHSFGNFSPGPVLALIVLLWVNDTGAYLVGITAGKNPLFKRISPKKSWEGFLGGLVFTILASLVMPSFFGITGTGGWLLVAVAVVAGGTFGDLVESMIKRKAEVKDSGNLIPGHGGFLDRFDSILFAWPLMFMILSFLVD
jgi:phosphatidate cytidylyltransferase